MKKISIFLSMAMLFSSASYSQEKDPVITTAPTPDVLHQGLKSEAKALGIMAYQWGYPLVRMEKVMRKYVDLGDGVPPTSYRAATNKIGWAKQLPGPKDTDMPTANNDTYYMSAVVVLDEPFFITVPDTDDRYYVINVFDMYHNLTDYIGRRTTGTEAGTYMILPPGWDMPVPDGVNKVIRPKTDKVWLWGRIHVKEGEDITAVHKLQDQFKLRSLSGTYRELPEWKNYDGELSFMYELAEAMKFNPILDEDKALVGMLQKIGLSKENGFQPEKLMPAQLEGLKEAMKDGPKTIVTNIATGGTLRNGWMWVTDLDNYGYKYGLRSYVCGPYLGGQGEKEAMYPLTYTDKDGKTLNGNNEYTLKFDKTPEVDAFWSLTMYDARTKLLIENPIDRYKIGSDTRGLKTNPDGSITINISNKKPKDMSNWLPAPDGDFYLILRLYQPKESLLDGRDSLPVISKIK